jgi:hypothetical protein
MFEDDGTPDNSPMTSFDTDFYHLSSASNIVRSPQFTSESSLITDEKSIDEDSHLNNLNVRLPICVEPQTLKTGEKIRCFDTDDNIEKECIGVNVWY